MHALTSCWDTPLAHMTIKFSKTRLQLCAQVGVTRRDGEAPRRRRAGAAAARLDVRQRPAPLRQRILPAVAARHAAMLCTLKRAQELLYGTAPTVNAAHCSPPGTMEKPRIWRLAKSSTAVCLSRDRLARLRAATAAMARWTAAGPREGRVAARNPTSALSPQGELIVATGSGEAVPRCGP